MKLASGYRAKARYRGYDGVTRDLSRTGPSKAKAERVLKLAIAQALQTPSGGDITARSRFVEVADRWLAWQERRVADGERAPGTLDNYRSMLANHVLPAFGELRMHEMTVPRLDRFFPALQAKSSAAHARTARAVVSGILRYAARHGAITANPIREIEPIEGSGRKRVRSLTAEERRAWLAQLELDPQASRKDLPDLTRFMLATGVRIGEALALYWEDVDLDKATVLINWTVVRVRGQGLKRTDPKTATSERALPLPSWAVEMLRQRRKTAVAENRPADSPVFPDTLGGLRDPSNTRRALREARGSEGFAWVTSHVFRKTAATIMDEAGLSARLIADQLGHSRPSITQDAYMGRGAVSSAAAAALEDIL
ncbi:tyrosine-type recombinase/integrase [Prauserella cavernicola]|uniref:tyrosine-type recombinase/integrase n=1 Tax=Prauserella cavernicola TaxID=2800127 RepID=UPI0027DE9965|nr:tyrosine-type recombinase/integrase [Prauserella cavernicola]